MKVDGSNRLRMGGHNFNLGDLQIGVTSKLGLRKRSIRVMISSHKGKNHFQINVRVNSKLRLESVNN